MLEDYEVDWPAVIAHYDHRLSLSEDIRQALSSQTDGFVDLCLGISNAQSNYSASEHNLGPRILSNNPNAKARVLRLAINLRDNPNAANMYNSIRAANINWLKISVGSEISMMLHPDICWVANTRTIWAHLIVKHDWNESWANDELRLYRDGDETSEMAYKKWTAIHREMQTDMTKLAETGSRIAIDGGLQPGAYKFLWADAIANWLYETADACFACVNLPSKQRHLAQRRQKEMAVAPGADRSLEARLAGQPILDFLSMIYDRRSWRRYAASLTENPGWVRVGRSVQGEVGRSAAVRDALTSRGQRSLVVRDAAPPLLTMRESGQLQRVSVSGGLMKAAASQ